MGDPRAAIPMCAAGAALAERTFGRRRLLTIGAGALGLGALAATFPKAASAETAYEAMILICIDPRFVEPTNQYMAQRGLVGDYSQFGLAGAAAGAVAPHWEAWGAVGLVVAWALPETLAKKNRTRFQLREAWRGLTETAQYRDQHENVTPRGILDDESAHGRGHYRCRRPRRAQHCVDRPQARALEAVRCYGDRDNDEATTSSTLNKAQNQQVADVVGRHARKAGHHQCGCAAQ